MAAPDPYVVVGAGPAALAAARALRGRDRPVVVLDTGLTLEPEREAARRRMAQTTPEHWRADDIRLTRFTAAAGRPGGYKRLFGSEVAFRDAGVLEIDAAPDVGARPSYALGGLSNVWGSGLLPYLESDLRQWPIGAADLEPGYRAALEVLPYAAERDELAERYPLFRNPDGPLLRTTAGEQLLARLRGRRAALAAAGYLCGGSRLAVRVGHPAPERGCIYCNHCLDGCPYGHIYSAAQTIGELAERGEIDYRPGLHVDRLAEADGGVLIQASGLDGAPGASLRASRAFIAAGAVSTTIILQRSGLIAEQAEILDSQALYVPFAWLGRIGRTGREPGHTLAQASIVLQSPAVSEHPVHITLYTYNDGLAERARASHPRLAALAGPTLQTAARHLVIGICFLHSDDSDRVAVSCAPGSRRVRLRALTNPRTRPTVARLLRSLARSLGRAGLIALAPLSELAPAGGGYHYGGSAPMRRHPRHGETDPLGRPAGTQRIHVVDSSCMPSVPGGAITFSAMANAHRIASAAAAAEA